MFDGVVRVTLPLPSGPRHVHAYLLEAADGWTAVDTGLGLPDAADTWREALGGVGPVTRIVITHFHPDHLGGAADLRALTGAPVLQSPRDAELTRLVWADATWPEQLAEWFERHGMPRAAARTIVDEGRLYGPFIRYAADPEILEDEIAGWRVVPTPGHADGHVCLLRDGVLVGGDHLLADISPAVGLYPHGDPDPLGHYLESLALVESLAPRLVLPAHGEPFEDGAGRARELLAHHRVRLDETLDALSAETPRTAHDVSVDLFGERLVDDSSRRFAVAETLAHLERLLVVEAAARGFSDGVVTYTRA